MKGLLSFMLLYLSIAAFAQNTFDAPMSVKHMKADLEQFRTIREAANSGVYKYRSPAEIDSIYTRAFAKLDDSETLGDLYNMLCKITDFEGSLHNDTQLPSKVNEALRKELQAYFPFMVKLVGEDWRCNNDNVPVPLGAKLISINEIKMQSIITGINRYFTTDGFNITGKQIGINVLFPYYFRKRYGKQSNFKIAYEEKNGQQKSITLKSISYQQYRNQQKKRHSVKADVLNYANDDLLRRKGKLYYSNLLNDSTAILVVNSFSIGGNENAPEHKAYVNFLDSTFLAFKEKGIIHLIVDVRYNGGGTDPNDLVTYSYLTRRDFQENVEAWIPFRKVPYWNRIKGEMFFLTKPIAKSIYQKRLKKQFRLAKNGKYYQDDTSNDHQIWKPNPNAFQGKIYLLISPRVASAGSLFAALLASDKTTTTIGEETSGGYYGHNGHTPIRYQLKHSKIKTAWSIVNLKQDVQEKANQPFGFGVRPDYPVLSTYADFINNEDAVMRFTLNLIEGIRRTGL